MLKIKTYVAPSVIAGKGLYTVDNIAMGQPVWLHDSKCDLIIEVDEIPPYLRDYFDKYSTVSKTIRGKLKYHLDGDDARFMNHSEDPNIVFIDSLGVALRDIEANEELTCDYREITTPEHFEYLMLIP